MCTQHHLQGASPAYRSLVTFMTIGLVSTLSFVAAHTISLVDIGSQVSGVNTSSLDGSAHSTLFLARRFDHGNEIVGYASPPPSGDSERYQRCKETHRCASGFSSYNVREATWKFEKSFRPKDPREPTSVFLDFEDWKAGTAGLSSSTAGGASAAGGSSTGLRGHPVQTRGAHFNTFWPELEAILRPALYLNHSCEMSIDTTALVASVVCDPVPEAPRIAVRRRRNPVRLFTPFVSTVGYADYNVTPLYATEDVIPVVAPAWQWLDAYRPLPSVHATWNRLHGLGATGDGAAGAGTRRAYVSGYTVEVQCVEPTFLPRYTGGGNWSFGDPSTTPQPFTTSTSTAYGTVYRDTDGDGYPDDASLFSRTTGLPAGVSARVADVQSTGCPYYRYRFNVTGARLYTRHGAGKAAPWRATNASYGAYVGGLEAEAAREAGAVGINSTSTAAGSSTQGRGSVGSRAGPQGVEGNGTRDGFSAPDVPAGVPVAVFHFESLFLGPSVRIRTHGSLPLVLVSRSALVLDTPIEVTPGTLGGFPGCRGPALTHTNVQGPGTTAVRTYTFTVSLVAEPRAEVQQVVTSVGDGDNLRGEWALAFPSVQQARSDGYQGQVYSEGEFAELAGATPMDRTTWIPALAEPSTVASAITQSLRLAGNVTVTRSNLMLHGGYTYNVTFDPRMTMGDLPQLRTISRLTGWRSSIRVRTVQDGESLEGSFRLTWRGSRTQHMSVQATAEEVQAAMQSAFAPVGLMSARVSRSNPRGRDRYSCVESASHLSAFHRTRYGGPVYRAYRIGNGDALDGSGGIPNNPFDASNVAEDLAGLPVSNSVGYSADPPADASDLWEAPGSAGGAGSGGIGVGSCVNGAAPAWGLVYSITLITHAGVVEAAYPSSPDLLSSDIYPPPADMTQAALEHALQVLQEAQAQQGAGLWHGVNLGSAGASSSGLFPGALSPFASGSVLDRVLGLAAGDADSVLQAPAAVRAGTWAAGPGNRVYGPFEEEDYELSAAGDVALLALLSLTRVWEANITHGGTGLLSKALALATQPSLFYPGHGATAAYPDHLAPYQGLWSYARHARRWVRPASLVTGLPTRSLLINGSMPGTPGATPLPGNALYNSSASLIDGVDPLAAEVAVDAILRAARQQPLPAHPLLSGLIGPRALLSAAALLAPILATSQRSLTTHPPDVVTADGSNLTCTGAFVRVSAGHWGSEATGLPNHAWIRPGDSFTGTAGAVERALLYNGSYMDRSWSLTGQTSGAAGPPGLVHQLGLSLSAYHRARGRTYGVYDTPGPDAGANSSFSFADTSAWLVTAAYGGAGGSHGGQGGTGHGPFPARAAVGQAGTPDLLGGSAGACGGAVLQDVLALSDGSMPVGAGGHGGGAVELIATTDLHLGKHSAVRVDGSSGESSHRAGGGGAGGSIVLAAGGSVVISGDLSARGGAGGVGVAGGGRGGGGGSGGRIAVFAQSIELKNGGNVRVEGGRGGRDEVVAPEGPTRRYEEPDSLAGEIPLPSPSPVLTGNPTYNGLPRTVRGLLAGAAGTVALVSTSAAAFSLEHELPSAGSMATPGAQDTRRSLRVSTAMAGAFAAQGPGGMPLYGVPFSHDGVTGRGQGSSPSVLPFQQAGPWIALTRPDARGRMALRRGGPVDLMLTMRLRINLDFNVSLQQYNGSDPSGPLLGADGRPMAGAADGATSPPGRTTPTLGTFLETAVLYTTRTASGNYSVVSTTLPTGVQLLGSDLSLVRDWSGGWGNVQNASYLDTSTGQVKYSTPGPTEGGYQGTFAARRLQAFRRRLRGGSSSSGSTGGGGSADDADKLQSMPTSNDDTDGLDLGLGKVQSGQDREYDYLDEYLTEVLSGLGSATSVFNKQPVPPVPKPRPEHISLHVRMGHRPPGAPPARGNWGLHVALHDDSGWDHWAIHALGALADPANTQQNQSASTAALLTAGIASTDADAALRLYLPALRAAQLNGAISDALHASAARARAFASLLPSCLNDTDGQLTTSAIAGQPCLLYNATGQAVQVLTGSTVRVAIREGNWVPSAAVPDLDASLLASLGGMTGFATTAAEQRAAGASGADVRAEFERRYASDTAAAGAPYWYAAPPRYASGVDALRSRDALLAGQGTGLYTAGDGQWHDGAATPSEWWAAEQAAALARGGHRPGLKANALDTAYDAGVYTPPVVGQQSGMPTDLFMRPAEHTYVYTTGGLGPGGVGAFPDGSGLPLDPLVVEAATNCTPYSLPLGRVGASRPCGVDAEEDGKAMIGIAVLNGRWVHGSNYKGSPGLEVGRGSGASSGTRGQGRPGQDGNIHTPGFAQAIADRWYKVDIHIDWARRVYKVRLDDVTVALDQPFVGDAVTRVGLYVMGAHSVAWFDEIYAGPDDTMGFECPVSDSEGEALRMRRPLQNQWLAEDVGPSSGDWDVVRHENHLSQREMYTDPTHAGLSYGDGIPHRSFFSDTGAARRLDGVVGSDSPAIAASALVGDGLDAELVKRLGARFPSTDRVPSSSFAGLLPSNTSNVSSSVDDSSSEGEVLAGSLLYVRGDDAIGAVLDAAATDGLEEEQAINRGQTSFGIDGRLMTEPRVRFRDAGVGHGPTGRGGDWVAGTDMPSHGSEQSARGGYAGSTGQHWWYGEHDNPNHAWYHPQGQSTTGLSSGQVAVPFANGSYPVYHAREYGLSTASCTANSTVAGDVQDCVWDASRGQWYRLRPLELRPSYAGGVAACSSRDMVSWRYEGYVLHHDELVNQGNVRPSNVTVPGSVVPGSPVFSLPSVVNGNDGNVTYRAFRPRVVLNMRFLPAELLELYPGLAYGAEAINCSLGTGWNATTLPAVIARLPRWCYNGSFVLNATSVGGANKGWAVQAPARTALEGLYEAAQQGPRLAVRGTDGSLGPSEEGLGTEDPYSDSFLDDDGQGFPFPRQGDGPAAYQDGNVTNVISVGELHALLNSTEYGQLYGSDYTGAAYIMWMGVDDHNYTRRLAGVAVSLHPGGPFTFLHSLRPDGNETVDHTIVQDPATGRAYIVRTYYQTTSYLLPQQIMQPVWESVKIAGRNLSEPADTAVDFALNYHRAYYSADYDNPNDVWRQMWRFEDKPWRIVTGNWTETFDVPTGTFRLTNETTGQVLSYIPAMRQQTLEQNLDRYTFRDIQGQGQRIIESRFQDPAHPDKAVWTPSSVPAIKAQPWPQNYREKNIADNPPHPTVADLLIGEDRVVEQRRAAYIAISPLDWSYSNTTHGRGMVIVEGSTPLLEEVDGTGAYPAEEGPPGRHGGHARWKRPRLSRDRLLSILSEYGRFGWSAGEGSHLVDGHGAVIGMTNTTVQGLLRALTAGDLASDRYNGTWGAFGFAPGAFNISTPTLSTYQPDVKGTKDESQGTFPFDTLVDWEDRFWQYNATVGDRALDFRNFRDRQGGRGYICPEKHRLVLIKLAECQAIMNHELKYEDTPAVKDFEDKNKSFFFAMNTSGYEACLAGHYELLKDYVRCLRDREPDLDALPEWNVGARDCVGGGGICGPPATGTSPNATYGFRPFNATAYGYPSTVFEPDLPSFNASNKTEGIVPSYYGRTMDGRFAGPVPGFRRQMAQGEVAERGEAGSRAEGVESHGARIAWLLQGEALYAERVRRGEAEAASPAALLQSGKQDEEEAGAQLEPLTSAEADMLRRLRAKGVSVEAPPTGEQARMQEAWAEAEEGGA